MGIIKYWGRLSCIKWISIIALSCYGLYPFINGLGCNFKSTSDDDNRYVFTTCELAVQKSYVKNKNTGEIYSYKGIYGRKGGTTMIIIYDFDEVSKGNGEVDNLGGRRDLLLKHSHIYFSSVLTADKNDWILLRSPYFYTYSTSRVGRLSWW